jgi:sarcosine oxidase subunit beta
MENTAEVIIVGAGIHGSSLAFHLAERGVPPLVLEKTFLAAGATGRSSGLVRMYYDLEPEPRMAIASLPYFRNWPERVGGECGFTRTGFIQILPRRDELRLRANVEMCQRAGIFSLVVSAADVRRLAPVFRVDDFDHAAYEPESGYADPPAAAKAFMDSARQRGARLVQDCRVTGIRVHGSRVMGVETTRGEFSAPVVVNAAGPWAPEIGRMVGLELPIKTLRHDVALFRRPPALGPVHPVVIDEPYLQYFRPETGRLMLVGLDDVNTLGESPDGPTEYVKPNYIGQAVERICRRVPVMDEGSLHSSYCGYEGNTADVRAILDQAGPDGFYLDCGFSGMGFKIAPAVGKCMSELILDGQARTVDLTPWRWDRFTPQRLAELLASKDAYENIWH